MHLVTFELKRIILSKYPGGGMNNGTQKSLHS